MFNAPTNAIGGFIAALLAVGIVRTRDGCIHDEDQYCLRKTLIIQQATNRKDTLSYLKPYNKGVRLALKTYTGANPDAQSALSVGPVVTTGAR